MVRFIWSPVTGTVSPLRPSSCFNFRGIHQSVRKEVGEADFITLSYQSDQKLHCIIKTWKGGHPGGGFIRTSPVQVQPGIFVDLSSLSTVEEKKRKHNGLHGGGLLLQVVRS